MMKDWIEIIAFTYPHEANLAKGLLEASGIEVIIKDELTVQVNNFYSNAIEGVKLFVEKSKTEEAMSVLVEGGYVDLENTRRDKEIEIFDTQYKSHCPYCNSANVTKKSLPGYTFALSILLLGFPLFILKRVYYCYDCLKEWRIGKVD